MAQRRRGHGEGSVYKREDGVWCASVDLGVVNGGHRLRRPQGWADQYWLDVQMMLGLKHISVRPRSLARRSVLRRSDPGSPQASLARWLLRRRRVIRSIVRRSEVISQVGHSVTCRSLGPMTVRYL
jgi:hypothetical protein